MPIFLATAVVILVRCVIAADSAFWCDELAFIIFGGKGFAASIVAMLHEPGPIGPLDQPLMTSLGRALILLGAHPHWTLRLYTIMLTAICGILPFLARRVPRPMAWSWFVLTALSPQMNAMALTARPSAGLLLTACVALFVVLEAPLRRGERPSLGFKALSAMSLPLGLAHPYGAINQAVGFFLVAARAIRAKGVLWFWLALLALPLLARPLWFFVIREPLARQPIDGAALWQWIVKEDWGRMLIDFTMAFPGPWVSWRAGLLFACLGLAALFRRKERRGQGLALVAAIVGSIAVPYLLSAAFHYPMSPRQWLGAYPPLLWLCIEGGALVARPLLRKPLLAAPLIAGAAWLCVARPALHFWRNGSPTVDVPRYKVHRILPALKEDRKVIVLSYCQKGVADLYASPEAFHGYFAGFAAARSGVIPESPRNIVWTTDTMSCFGALPPAPQDPAILQDVRRSPGSYFVLAPRGVAVPAVLAGIECRTETDEACAPHQVR